MELSQFGVIGKHKVEGYKCSFSIRNKGAMQKTQEEDA
jgi:hypothetical protein